MKVAGCVFYRGMIWGSVFLETRAPSSLFVARHVRIGQIECGSRGAARYCDLGLLLAFEGLYGACIRVCENFLWVSRQC